MGQGGPNWTSGEVQDFNKEKVRASLALLGAVLQSS